MELIRAGNVPNITESLKTELEARNISRDERKEIENKLDLQYKIADSTNDEKLSTSITLLVLVLPFFITAHSIGSSFIPGGLKSRKYKDYWKYLRIGYAAYLILFFISVVVYYRVIN
ncbi:MAG: hypothetical protein JKY54_00335 [Flavobacteriales bacterium]|nr:hypothetical protein [Flavobacteriales bacterium]